MVNRQLCYDCFLSFLYTNEVNILWAATQKSDCMWALELSSYVLEIPNNAYMTLSQNQIEYSALGQ